MPILTSSAALLLLAFGAAFGAQLVRQLSKSTVPKARRVIFSAIAAGLAGVAALGLAREWLGVGAELTLALSLVVGWSGAPILDVLGRTLGSRLTGPDRS